MCEKKLKIRLLEIQLKTSGSRCDGHDKNRNKDSTRTNECGTSKNRGRGSEESLDMNPKDVRDIDNIFNNSAGEKLRVASSSRLAFSGSVYG
eukprot:1346702-Amorphochlora_amoeboformis.AAC.1